MASIFLSYSREDHSSAHRLARVVEAAGHDVWWDQHLDSGEEFAAALDKAEVVLVCWSTLSVKSRWVRDEASVGGDSGRLVPVSIDGTLPPMGFRQFQTPDLTGWKGGKREARTTELLSGLLARGDFDAMQRIEEQAGPGLVPPNYPKTNEIAEAVKAKSAPALHRACARGESLPFMDARCMIAYGILGDMDGAYSIADKLFPRRVGSTPAEMEKIWLDDPESPPLEFITSPAAAPLRRDPRFLPLASRTGPLAYWRNRTPPDFCTGKSPERVCKALRRP